MWRLIKLLLRLGLSLLVLIGSFMLYDYLLTEAAVLYQLWATGTSQRAELADDLGFGLLGFLVVLPLSALLALVTSLLVWLKTK
ncbi:hypothetical protein [Rheinheimera sp.]|uniref:hypothetical protein n=1 Tax=Rheinheimera sp. TaxID=1869214 RepID=UPI003AF76840